MLKDVYKSKYTNNARNEMKYIKLKIEETRKKLDTKLNINTK